MGQGWGDPSGPGVANEGRVTQITGETKMKAIAVLAVFPAFAIAQELPLVIGTVPNQDNSKITFTTYRGDCTGTDWMVYAQADGGQVKMTGCYRMIGDELFVVWDDGDIYTYSLQSLSLSTDMRKWLKNKRPDGI